ncbi:hypothetical protein ABIA30_003579 [Mycobacterium sp. MAA66]
MYIYDDFPRAGSPVETCALLAHNLSLWVERPCCRNRKLLPHNNASSNPHQCDSDRNPTDCRGGG